MNEAEIGKYKLKEAFLDYCKYYMDNIETVPVYDSAFSPKLNQNMKKLIRAQKNPVWKYVNTVGKRIAAACFIVIILGGILMSCKPIREPVFRFFVNVYEKFTEIFTSSENSDIPIKLEERKTLTYVPEGYKMKSRSDRLSIWKNENGEIIKFLQSTLNNGATTFDTEMTHLNKIEYNGRDIYYTTSKGMSTYYCFDDNYKYCIICNDNLPTEEILKMIDSIK